MARKSKTAYYENGWELRQLSRRSTLAAWDRAVFAYRTACAVSDRIDRKTCASHFRADLWPEEKAAWIAVADTDSEWRRLSGLSDPRSPFGTAQGL